MEQNPYAPPVAAVAEIDARDEGHRFYVVSRRKFFALYFVTLSLYRYYWSYKHWALFRERTGKPIWPVVRAIFPIFFTHSMAEEIDKSLDVANVVHRWRPMLLATSYVVLAIASRIAATMADRGIGYPAAPIAMIGILLPLAVTLWFLQDAANRACGDPDARSNEAFTGLNWLWAAFGLCYWVLMSVGLYMIANGLY